MIFFLCVKNRFCEGNAKMCFIIYWFSDTNDVFFYCVSLYIFYRYNDYITRAINWAHLKFILLEQRHSKTNLYFKGLPTRRRLLSVLIMQSLFNFIFYIADFSAINVVFFFIFPKNFLENNKKKLFKVCNIFETL